MPLKSMRVKSAVAAESGRSHADHDAGNIFRADVGYFRHLRLPPRSFKEFQFLAIFLTCLVLALFQTGKCVERYLDKETGTADKYVSVATVSFPVMTLCPSYPYHLDVIKENGWSTLSDIQWNANWVSNDTSVSALAYYQDVVQKFDEMAHDVVVYTNDYVNGKNMNQYKTNDTACGGQKWFKVKRYYFNGDCFQLTMPKCLLDAGILELDFTFKAKMDMFIHHPDQFLSPNSRSRIDVAVGNFIKIAINHEVVQLMDFRGSCVNSYGLDGNFDDCMYARLTDLMMDELNCTVPWLPDQSHICVEPTKRKRAFDIYQANRRNQNNVCPNSCLFTNMYFGPPVTGVNNFEDRNTSKAYFYFRKDIKSTGEYILYNTLTLLADIGGYMGLLLGFSLFELAKINNFFIDYIVSRSFFRPTKKQDSAIYNTYM